MGRNTAEPLDKKNCAVQNRKNDHHLLKEQIVILRWLIWVCVAIAASITLYLLTAVLGGLIGGPMRDVPIAARDQTIALAIGPAHTDLLLPLNPKVRAAFGFADAGGVPVMNPQAQWLVIGWGARGVYTTMGTWGDVSLPALWQAAIGDEAVMRVDVLGPFDTSGLDVIPVSNVQMAVLADAILASLARDAQGQPVPLPDAGFTATDRYYTATGTFHVARTCNVWMSETLRSAGIPFGIWTPTPFAMRLSLWRLHSPG
jgi:uncharacterized protein (TIGR02117 family)